MIDDGPLQLVRSHRWRPAHSSPHACGWNGTCDVRAQDHRFEPAPEPAEPQTRPHLWRPPDPTMKHRAGAHACGWNGDCALPPDDHPAATRRPAHYGGKHKTPATPRRAVRNTR